MASPWSVPLIGCQRVNCRAGTIADRALCDSWSEIVRGNGAGAIHLIQICRYLQIWRLSLCDGEATPCHSVGDLDPETDPIANAEATQIDAILRR
ncbi:hypothetical protein PG993_011577 [Apiospora rasikravindrae]|uniref:Uncharacterized protein n=1 Tax=Apiospora rasikravindrae TaxID=990691 RepID=A0ABR1S1L5_9PEZI